jgi:hypothetical protein
MSATRSCSKLLEPSATESIAVRSSCPSLGPPLAAQSQSSPSSAPRHPPGASPSSCCAIPSSSLRMPTRGAAALLRRRWQARCGRSSRWRARRGRSSRWRARPPAVEVRACSTVEVVAEPPPTRAPRPVSRLGAPRWGSMSRPLPWGSAWRPPLRSSAPSRLPARSKLPPVHEELPLAHSLSPSTTPASLWPSLIPHVLGLGINCCLL